jgi:hypothetical protein
MRSTRTAWSHSDFAPRAAQALDRRPQPIPEAGVERPPQPPYCRRQTQHAHPASTFTTTQPLDSKS